MPIMDHFGFIAPFYDRFASAEPPQKLLALLDLPEGGVILDVGGGTGRIAQHLRQKGGLVVVVDESLRMLAEAGRKPGLHPVRAQAEKLPFGDETVDRILMVDAFHHLADQRQALEELQRVLVPGGKLVIEEPNIRNWVVKLIALGEKVLLMRSRFLNPEKIAAIFPSDVRVHTVNQMGIAWIIAQKSFRVEKAPGP